MFESIKPERLRNERSKCVYKVEWSYESQSEPIEVESFKVLAIPSEEDPDADRPLLPIQFPVTDPNSRSTQIELEKGTKFSLSVEVHFTNRGLQPQKSKTNMEFRTPDDSKGFFYSASFLSILSVYITYMYSY